MQCDVPELQVNWALSPGDVLGHYRVIAPLGAGGMGQVFLAEDTRLGRKLALKVLAPQSFATADLIERFDREARTVSALNHPNIITMYDTGQIGGMRFIATEFIEGKTLRTLLGRGRMDVRQSLEIAAQVAQALVAAHDAGVVHRDLKPENVMLRHDGYVKVLDFGLAKLSGIVTSPRNVGAARALETAAGIVMGTVRYMAPEQARGQEVDARTDLFALGVVLYEMLAGATPFTGATAADTIGALLRQDPPPIADVPDDVNRIALTALRKDRRERYQSGARLLDALRSAQRALESRCGAATLLMPWTPPMPASNGPMAGAPTPGTQPTETTVTPRRRHARRTPRSLAVLPIAADHEHADHQYIAEGLTESLINSLSQMPRLRVMARSTVVRCCSTDVDDPRAVGRELGVQAVLTGRLTQRGETFAVSVALIDVEDGTQLWGTILHRPPRDLFTLQADIAHELTAALSVRLTREQKQRLARRHTASASAYRLYLRGRYLCNQRTRPALEEAQMLLEQAVTDDADYALAYAALADCCALLAVSLRPSSSGPTIRKAREAAFKALALDDGLAEGHASLAFIAFRFDWDWPRAEAEFVRALALNPGHAPSRQWHAMFLAARSRLDAALAEMQAALELDPLSLVVQTGVGRILHFARRFEDAVIQYNHVLQTNPSFGQAHLDLALTHLATGQLAAARECLERAERLMGRVSTIMVVRGVCAVREGRADEARSILAELQSWSQRSDTGIGDLACLAAELGDWGLALPWLREACAMHAAFIAYVDVEPVMSPLLENPESRALLRPYGFASDPDGRSPALATDGARSRQRPH
jgi:serine/threonine-protein kinase